MPGNLASFRQMGILNLLARQCTNVMAWTQIRRRHDYLVQYHLLAISTRKPQQSRLLFSSLPDSGTMPDIAVLNSWKDK
ncbi:hypothetical protein BH20ACI3_BH20ACI3_02360 [soil metagenome]